jgi:hypothetical protein
VSHKKPYWFLEWYLIAVVVIALLLLLFAPDAQGAEKNIDDLGLDLISRVQILWPTVKCSEWPEKNGDYKCSGTFFIHPNGIKAKHP